MNNINALRKIEKKMNTWYDRVRVTHPELEYGSLEFDPRRARYLCSFEKMCDEALEIYSEMSQEDRDKVTNLPYDSAERANFEENCEVLGYMSHFPRIPKCAKRTRISFLELAN